MTTRSNGQAVINPAVRFGPSIYEIWMSSAGEEWTRMPFMLLGTN